MDLLHHRSFRDLFAATIVSDAGDSLMTDRDRSVIAR
jgi:hypothetical protein